MADVVENALWMITDVIMHTDSLNEIINRVLSLILEPNVEAIDANTVLLLTGRYFLALLFNIKKFQYRDANIDSTADNKHNKSYFLIIKQQS